MSPSPSLTLPPHLLSAPESTGHLTPSVSVPVPTTPSVSSMLRMPPLISPYMMLTQRRHMSTDASGGGGSEAASGGQVLPNAENATIDMRKLTGYALNEDHPQGKHKARVFKSALGMTAEHADSLHEQILAGVQSTPTTGSTREDEHGVRHTVDVPVQGPNGQTKTVRTGWIVPSDSSAPRLTTAYVHDKP